MKTRRTVPILGILFPVLLLVLYSFVTSTNELKDESQKPITESNTSGEAGVEFSNLDVEAMDKLQNALDYLSNLKQFSVKVQSTLEDMDGFGHRVDYEMASKVVLKRPNKLRTEQHGGWYDQTFYYNGESITMYHSKENVYATGPAPENIDEMFHFARDTYGISAPVSDLLYTNAFELLSYEINYAVVVDMELINEVECDHLLFSRPGVDFQIWVAKDGAPLPYKYVITDTTTPELLSYTIVMRDWNIAPIVSKKEFNFKPPHGANVIEFQKLD